MKKFMYIDLVDDNYHPRMIEWYVVTPNLVHPFGQKKSAFAKDIWESHPYSYTCYEVRISLSFIIAQVSLGQWHSDGMQVISSLYSHDNIEIKWITDSGQSSA